MLVMLDLQGTVGFLRRTDTEGFFDELVVLDDTRTAMEGLRARGETITILAPPPAGPTVDFDALLSSAGLTRFYDAVVVFPEGGFEILAQQTQQRFGGQPRRDWIFVSPAADRRRAATAAGFIAVQHPNLCRPAAQGQPLVYARLEIRRAWSAAAISQVLQDLSAVPIEVDYSRRTLYVIGSRPKLEEADPVFSVRLLSVDDAPSWSDAYFFVPDTGASSSALATKATTADSRAVGTLLEETEQGFYVALASPQLMSEFLPPSGGHTHGSWLSPSMSLVRDEPADIKCYRAAADALHCASEAAGRLDPQSRIVQVLTQELKRSTLERHVRRYSGDVPLDNGRSIVSRNVAAARDNAAAADQLVLDLRTIDPAAASYSDGFVRWVEASLPPKTPRAATVLVTAHFDSIADRNGLGRYDPETDPAPGADDDASGIAAVLACAEAIKAYGPELKTCGIRFVLFNKEENGMAGSIGFAQNYQKSLCVVAGLQMDMIGFRPPPSQGEKYVFEIHTGFPPSPDLASWSASIGDVVLRVASAWPSPSLTGQLYPGTLGTDDGYNSSDHSRLSQYGGWGACAISEDFFSGPNDIRVPGHPSPGYHNFCDTVASVDFEYATDIARIVAATAILIAENYH